MYNTTTVNFSRALSIALTYIDAGIVPLFIGSPGIGKTRLAKLIAEELSADLFSLRLNNILPEDAVGLQFVDRETKQTVRYAPKWVPAADGSDGPRVVFLDEILQATDEQRKGIMSALLERYIGDNELPDNCYFVAAANSSDDGSFVYEMDSATADRFGVIRVISDVEQWARDFAADADIELSIMGFLRMRPDLFDGYTHDETSVPDADHENETIRASARTWTKASTFLKRAAARRLSEEDTITGLSGLLGTRITNAFWHYIKNYIPFRKCRIRFNNGLNQIFSFPYIVITSESKSNSSFSKFLNIFNNSKSISFIFFMQLSILS